MTAQAKLNPNPNPNPQPSQVKSFADLLYPITPELFFREYFGKQPLHIQNQAWKAADLPNWQGLSDLLNQTAIWNTQNLKLALDREVLPSQAYCEEVITLDRPILRPDPIKIMEFVKKGATIVANDIDSFTEGLRTVANVLEHALDGKAQANLYCSSRQRQAFDSHFDAHDVFAVHCDGEKRWKVYQTKEIWPIHHRRYDNHRFNLADREKRRGEVALDIVMKPGDLLYIPRGQYHDAMAAKAGSIHIAFGVTQLIGLELVNLATDMLVDMDIFRQPLPRTAEGERNLAQHLGKLGQAFAELSRNPQFAANVRAYQQAYRYKRGGISLPVTPETINYRLNGVFSIEGDEAKGANLVSAKGKVKIPPDKLEMTRWVLAQKAPFDRFDFMDEFAHIPGQNCDRFLTDLMTMGLIRKT